MGKFGLGLNKEGQMRLPDLDTGENLPPGEPGSLDAPSFSRTAQAFMEYLVKIKRMPTTAEAVDKWDAGKIESLFGAAEKALIVLARGKTVKVTTAHPGERAGIKGQVIFEAPLDENSKILLESMFAQLGTIRGSFANQKRGRPAPTGKRSEILATTERLFNRCAELLSAQTNPVQKS